MFDIVSYRPNFRMKFTTFAGIVNGPQLCNVAPSRALLVISNQQGGVLAVSMRPDVVQSTGMYLIPGGSQIELFWERHGLMVTQDWYAATIGAGPGVNVTELFWEPTRNQ